MCHSKFIELTDTHRIGIRKIEFSIFDLDHRRRIIHNGSAIITARREVVSETQRMTNLVG